MIGVAVIGAGHWGPNLIRNFHNQQTSVVRWVVDQDTARLEQVGQRFPDVAIGADAEIALADKRVDAVVVATPTTTHYHLAKAALLGGKHVLVEKPITADSGQGRELCELAEKVDRILMVGHVFIYNPAITEVKQYLDEGSLGRLYYISMVRTNLGPIRMDVNASWDLAAHDVSISNFWLDGPPLAASAYGGTWINAGLEDAVFITLRYPNEVLVNLHVSWLNPRKARDITVVGERCMLTVDDMNLGEPLRIYDKGVTDKRTRPVFADTFASFRASIREGDITIPRVSLGEPLRTECEHFIECVSTGVTPLTDGWAGLDVVNTLEAIDRSIAANGQEQPVAAVSQATS
jgi:predicted dehydrogenase